MMSVSFQDSHPPRGLGTHTHTHTHTYTYALMYKHTHTKTHKHTHTHTHLRVAVWELVVALVCLHSELEVTHLTSEASLMPCLQRVWRVDGRSERDDVMM